VHYTCWAVFFWTKENSVQREFKSLPLSEIIDHPINGSIYRDGADDDLVESVKQNGIMAPIDVFYDSSRLCYVCISGHRRRDAAAKAGLKEIPAYLLDDDLPEWEQIRRLVHLNKQREKTVELKGRETAALDHATKLEAESRKKSGKKQDHDLRKHVSEGLSETDKGRSLAEAARATGLGSRPHAERVLKVIDKIDELEESGEIAKAEELRQALNTKSVRKAAEMAEEIDEEPEETQEAIVDEYGVPVPEMLRQVWIDAEELRQLMRDLVKIKSRIGELEAKPHGRWIDRQHAETLCQDLRSAIKFALPHVECGECKRDEKKRKSCKLCRARGYVTEQVHKNSSREAKTWIENRSSK
jgi:ParB-like chromosome segregation protein Spo0J